MYKKHKLQVTVINQFSQVTKKSLQLPVNSLSNCHPLQLIAILNEFVTSPNQNLLSLLPKSLKLFRSQLIVILNAETFTLHQTTRGRI